MPAGSFVIRFVLTFFDLIDIADYGFFFVEAKGETPKSCGQTTLAFSSDRAKNPLLLGIETSSWCASDPSLCRQSIPSPYHSRDAAISPDTLEVPFLQTAEQSRSHVLWTVWSSLGGCLGRILHASTEIWQSKRR
eukprot:s4560_g1.t1